MIFKPELVVKVLDGTKTMTRRRKHQPLEACPFRVGAVRAVQPGRGKVHVTHVALIDVRHERLADIGDEDARREGFASRDDFFAYWLRLYGAITPDEWLCVVDWAETNTLPCCAPFEASA